MRYRSKKVTIDGITFDSKMEAERFRDLKLELKIKGIPKLLLQPRFELVVNGVKIGRYTGDFLYYENGKTVVEEVKGYKTDVYRLRIKIFKALYPFIEFREINRNKNGRKYEKENCEV